MQTHVLIVFESLPTFKGFLHPNIEDMSLFIRIVMIFHLLIVILGIAFHYLSNPTSDTFFKLQQLVYASKKLKLELI